MKTDRFYQMLNPLFLVRIMYIMLNNVTEHHEIC